MSPGMQWLDPLVTLSMCAAVTDRVRLGTSVLVLPYRNPVNLAAEAAALDVLTDGRFILGVGCGWMREEFRRSASIPRSAGRAPTSTSRCCAHCGLRIRRASTADSSTSTASCSPPPPRTEGGPPIWVGGNTDAGLRRALRLGDGWHGFEVYPGGHAGRPRAAGAHRRRGGPGSRRAGPERRARADAPRAARRSPSFPTAGCWAAPPRRSWTSSALRRAGGGRRRDPGQPAGTARAGGARVGRRGGAAAAAARTRIGGR